VFLKWHFLFCSSDTFAVERIVYPENAANASAQRKSRQETQRSDKTLTGIMNMFA